jgi:hypothetical protein
MRFSTRRHRSLAAAAFGLAAVFLGAREAEAAGCDGWAGQVTTDNDGSVVTFTQLTRVATLKPGERLNFSIQPVGGGPSDHLLEVDNVPEIAPPGTNHLLAHPGGPAPASFTINVFLHEAVLRVTGTCKSTEPDGDGGGGGKTPTDATHASKVGQSLHGMVVGGRLPSNAGSLPGATHTAIGACEEAHRALIEGQANGLSIEQFNDRVRSAREECSAVDPATPAPLPTPGLTLREIRDALEDATQNIDPNTNITQVLGVNQNYASLEELEGYLNTCEESAASRRLFYLQSLSSIESDESLLQNQIDKEKKLLQDEFSGISGSRIKFDDAGAEIRRLRRKIEVSRGMLQELKYALNENIKRCKYLRAAVDAKLGLDGGDAILYAPKEDRVGTPAAVAVPWPDQALGYGEMPMSSRHSVSHGTEARLSIGGRPANLWTRMQGTLHDGSLDRSGVSGSMQAGLVVGVGPYVDVGVFGQALAGEAQSDVLDAHLDTLAGGVGAYVKIATPSRLRFGLSAFHEWGSNDIVIGAATGSFASTHWSVSADASMPFRAGNFTITPSLVAALLGGSLSAYVNSLGLAVPGSTTSQFTVSGGVELAYPIHREDGFITTLVPRLSLRGNYLASGAEAIEFGPAIGRQASSAFTLDAGAGIGMGFQSGSSLNMNLTARGLLGSDRRFGVLLRYQMPLR